MTPKLLFVPALSTWGAAHVGVGFPGMINASVSVTALHPVELELGVEGSLGHQGLTARAGPALRVLERRDAEGKGITMHAPMLLGYRRFAVGTTDAAHALTANPTLTFDGWVSAHVAVELQVTAGVSVMVADPQDRVGSTVLPDFQVRMGMAF